ncbi:SDR family NAD(P)-dependent oxidoreductase [bacterium]|nr:SDR family NAD(P)-dependent oxidoreductase [bacterium]
MKTYVITGATSGIGNSLVREFSADSVVFAGYRNFEKREELQNVSKNVIPFFIDMTQSESITKAVEFITSKTDKVDTLINVAGCVVAGAVENIEIDSIRRQFEVNTFSHLQLTQGLFRCLEGGKIINISSMASYGIFPFVAPYCASKRALDILFSSLEIETGGKVKVVSIKPGVIATPLWEKSIKENAELLTENSDYEKEMKFLVGNAKNNGVNGLDVKKVVDLVVRVDGMKNPQSSYKVGNDAIGASIVSRLPQNVVNKLVSFGLKLRVK